MLKVKNGSVLPKWKVDITYIWYVAKLSKNLSENQKKIKKEWGAHGFHICLGPKTWIDSQSSVVALNLNFWCQTYLIDRYLLQTGSVPKMWVSLYKAS